MDKNIHADQKDMNIELCHKLFHPKIFRSHLEKINNKTSLDIADQYRKSLVLYLIEQYHALYEPIFNTTYDEKQTHRSETVFVRRGIELILEGSLLTKHRYHVEEMLEEVNTLHIDDVTDDVPMQVLHLMVESMLDEAKPNIVAISIPYYSQLFPSLMMAKWIKIKSPETFVILGGQQLMLRHSTLRKLPDLSRWVDAIGTSSGEETLSMLHHYVKGERKKEEVPNIIWIHDDPEESTIYQKKMNITDVPPPNFTNLPLKKYLSDNIQFALITCVGCYWGKCAFCSYGNRSKFEHHYQQKTASQIAKECIHILDLYPTHRINFVDENTNLKLICKALKIVYDKGYRATFSTRNRLEDILLDATFCKTLSQYGVVQMSVGYETNSQRLLNMMNKGVNSDNYQQIIDNLHEAGIEIRLSVMGGLPSETDEEALASEQFLQANENKIGIDVVQMLVMEPDTFLSRNPEQYDLQQTSTEQLQGNPDFSYGMGRVGYSFSYESGAAHDERLQRLYRLVENVNPQFNDDVPNESHHKDVVQEEIQLKDWVKITKAEIDEQGTTISIVIDLLFERIFQIPDEIDCCEQTMRSTSPEGQQYLQDLVNMNMAVFQSQHMQTT